PPSPASSTGSCPPNKKTAAGRVRPPSFLGLVLLLAYWLDLKLAEEVLPQLRVERVLRQPVVDGLRVAARGHEAVRLELGQVLGDGRNRNAEHLRQVTHAEFFHVLEEVEELQAGGVP